MNEPFNSQTPNFLTKVKAYCAKVLPLVFDNSLSYYEFLCKVCHKLNETIDALNAQNLNIIEFTHMVQLEVEKFESYIDDRITNFENEIKEQWEEYKNLINAAFEEFKTQIRTEWEQEKQLNESFRENMLQDFNSFKSEVTAAQTAFENKIKSDFETYKTTVNDEISQFENRTNASLSTFKTTMQTQQNEFENHMTALFNNFKTTEKQARTDFESNFQQLFEQWKVDTLAAFDNNINEWETGTAEALKTIINEQMRIYKEAVDLKLSDMTRQLTLEANARENADNALQQQINQLTPTGTIKADTADSQGNSQLYVIEPDTSERKDIFPKVKGGGVQMTTPDENNNVQLYMVDETGNRKDIFPNIHGGNFLPGIATTYCLSPIHLIDGYNNDYIEAIAGTFNGNIAYKLKAIPTKGTIQLHDSIFSFNTDQIDGTPPDNAVDLFLSLNVNVKFYSDNDWNNELSKIKPQLSFYWSRYENNVFKVGARLTTNGETDGTLALDTAYLSIAVSRQSSIRLD